MAVLKWDESGKKWIHTGVEKVTLRNFGTGTPGVGGTCSAWNGVTALSVSPSGAEVTKLYADNIIYMEMMSVETVGASIEAYNFPKEFETCNGIKTIAEFIKVKGQKRTPFSLAWRTKEQYDTQEEHDILHILYNCLAAPSEVANATISDSPEAVTFSWEISCTPLPEFTLMKGSTAEKFKNVYKFDIDLTKWAANAPQGKGIGDLLTVFETSDDTTGWTPAALAAAGLISGYSAS